MGKKGKSANKYRKVEISHENIKRENIKAYKGIIFFSLILLTIVIGTSYALFSSMKTSKETIEVQAGTFKISFLDSNYINLENTYPMTDEEGFNTQAYKFTIKNDGTLNAKYNISLEESEGNTLDKSYIKYRIREEEGTWSEPALLSNGTILLDNRQLNSEEDINYELQLWLDEKAPNEIQGTKYQAKIVVSATQTNANIVNVAQPIINLDGASVMSIGQNTIFTDLGVSSIQAKEEIDISTVTKRYEYFDGVNTTPVEGVDTSKVGTYFIYYEVLDSNGNKGMAIRIVNVYKPDTAPPEITVVGGSTITLDYDAVYTDQGAIAQDTVDGDLTSKIVTVGKVNTKLEGIQIVKYLIIDSEGNTASAVRTVTVRRKYEDASGELTINKLLSTPAKQVIDINIVTVNTPLTFVIATDENTPSDSDYKTIEELQTEGLAEDGKLIFNRNGDYVIWIKDSQGAIVKRKINIDGIDTTKPTCQFTKLGFHNNGLDNELEFGYIAEGSYDTFMGTGFDVKLFLECYDIVHLEKTYLTDQIVTATNPDILEIVSIGEPYESRNVNDWGYTYEIYIRGLKPGTSKLVLPEGVITDRVGNVNDEVTSYDITVAELEVETDENNEIEIVLGRETTKQLEVSGTNLYEKLVYHSSNESVVTVDENGMMTAVAPGKTTVTVEDPQSGAFKVVNVKVTAQVNFSGGEGVQALTTTRETCTFQEGSSECTVTLPSFEVMEGYELVGWNKSASEGVGTLPGETIVVTEAATYYAIAMKPKNENIKAVYTYNQTAAEGEAGRCITGNETTCQENTCTDTKTKDSCPVGTIIKYAVNDSEEKVFYVLHDDGRNMTVQQRETLIQARWSATSSSESGPIPALDALDEATSGWTNVRNQTYTLGVTNFLENSSFADREYANSNTICPNVAACTGTYQLVERTGKARFITLQEVRVTGCGTKDDAPNCPIWMYNYMKGSIQNGGTDDCTDCINANGSGNGLDVYQTMSARDGSNCLWMRPEAYIDNSAVSKSKGIRPVIVIDK